MTDLPPLPDPPFPGREANQALRERYEEDRRQWRKDHPIVSREQIAELEQIKEADR